MRRKVKDLQKLKDRHLDQVSNLKSINKQLHTDLYDDSEEVSSALKENHTKHQSYIGEYNTESLELLNGKDAWIRAITQLHLVEISTKSAEVRKLASKFNADRTTANIQ